MQQLPDNSSMKETFESEERFASNVGSGDGVHRNAIVLSYHSVCTLQE